MIATSASAASINVNTVGAVNGNVLPVLEATGNSLNVGTFASVVGTAFANNTGGVWNFDGDPYTVNAGETVTLNYGVSLANSLVLTVGGNGINQSANPTEATSGGTVMGLNGDAVPRTFSLNTPLLTLGIFNTDRNGADRFPVLTVTYQDTTTASTSGANADNTYFHGLSGTLANPIVSFTLSQNNFVRYDDLGFVVAAVPEPGTAALVGLGLALSVAMRRRLK